MRSHGGRYPLLADEDLISRLGDGDAQAFALLYDRHSRAAFSLAYRMMGERQASEDLAQDAFIKIWRGAPSESLYGWVACLKGSTVRREAG